MLQATSLLPIKKGSHIHPNCSAWIQMLQPTLCPLAKGLPYPSRLYCITLDIADDFLLPITKGGVLPTQPLVLNSRCCIWLFTCPLAKGESYPPKPKCKIPAVVNDFFLALVRGELYFFMTTNAAKCISPTHSQGGSLTYLNSSAWLKILQTNFSPIQ